METIADDISVYAPMAIFGVAAGNVVIQHGGALLLYGTCAGNVEIRARGRVAIYGTVVGSVTNHGGELHLFGKVLGGLHAETGQTKVYAVAQILGAENVASSPRPPA